MNYAVLYNVFLCWMVALVSLVATHSLVGRTERTLAMRALALSWAFAALLWGTAGLRLLAYFSWLLTLNQTFVAMDKGIFLVGEIFLGGQMVAIVLFATDALWKNRRVNTAATAVALAMAVIFVAVLFRVGLAGYQHTTWGSEHVLPPQAFAAFIPLFGLSLLLNVFLVAKGLWAAWRGGAGPGRVASVAAAAVILYGVAGLVDVRGTWGGWQLLLIRVNYLVAALLTFWVARPADVSMRVVREKESA